MNETETTHPQFSESYKRYVLLILTGVYIFNFIDRQILVILQESIKADLGLSDTQLGLLTGFAFAVFYVTLAIPIARWADKANRKNIIVLSLTIWSAMTALSGLAANYVHLLLARIGVGIGEAGASPPAHSIISDYFSEEKRGTALAVYSMGIYIGVLLGFLFGGWLDEFFGWRIALMALGIPGMLYALFVFFTIKEPPRGYAEKLDAASIKNYTLMEVFRVMITRKAFIFLALACGFNGFVLYGVGNWLPSFLGRVHGMETGEIGTWLAISLVFGGAIGVWLGGYLSDRFGKISRRYSLMVVVVAIALSIPSTIFLLFSNTRWIAITSIFICMVLWTTYLAPSIAMTHGLVAPRMRALGSAILFLVLNFIGLGLGPLFVGILSDYLQPQFGVLSLRWALSMMIGVSVITVWLFWKAAGYLEADLARAPR